MLRFLDAKIVEGDEATIFVIEDCPERVYIRWWQPDTQLISSNDKVSFLNFSLKTTIKKPESLISCSTSLENFTPKLINQALDPLFIHINRSLGRSINFSQGLMHDLVHSRRRILVFLNLNRVNFNKFDQCVHLDIWHLLFISLYECYNFGDNEISGPITL